ncbi:MAG: hypothetical protein HY908_25420 [Myxococcales bacterium]|nr:hypothetical protein [Myxococcales bacterium]
MPDDSDFDKIPIGSLSDNACTPKVDDDWDFRGLRIAAPRRVPLTGKPDAFGCFARAPVCGVYQLDSNYLGFREQFRTRVILVAVDARSHRAYANRLQTIVNPARMASPLDGMMLTEADWAGRYVTQFFNPNLVSLLALPEMAAEYIVYATLGRYVSNVVRITLEG